MALALPASSLETCTVVWATSESFLLRSFNMGIERTSLFAKTMKLQLVASIIMPGRKSRKGGKSSLFSIPFLALLAAEEEMW